MTLMRVTRMKLIHQKQLLMMFPIEGSDLLRQHVMDNIIYFRPSHQTELEALMLYAIKRGRSRLSGAGVWRLVAVPKRCIEVVVTHISGRGRLLVEATTICLLAVVF